jgi:hypothetical protein
MCGPGAIFDQIDAVEQEAVRKNGNWRIVAVSASGRFDRLQR